MHYTSAKNATFEKEKEAPKLDNIKFKSKYRGTTVKDL